MNPRQQGYRILPPQDVFEASIRDACNALYYKAENVLVKWRCNP